jgi:RNA polymerase sigma-70 factor (ECF subfamily)
MDDTTSPDSSAELLARWRAGDEQAAGKLWRRYAVRLIALARKRLSASMNRHVDPEDLVQSAYRCFFAGDRGQRYVLRHSGDLWRLLVAITLHKVHDQAKRHRAKKRDLSLEQHFGEATSLQQLQTQMLAHDPTPAEAAALTDELELILRALTAEQRRMVEMRLQGYQLDEIAAATRHHERTVRRVMKGFKQQLQQRCLEWTA